MCPTQVPWQLNVYYSPTLQKLRETWTATNVINNGNRKSQTVSWKTCRTPNLCLYCIIGIISSRRLQEELQSYKTGRRFLVLVGGPSSSLTRCRRKQRAHWLRNLPRSDVANNTAKGGRGSQVCAEESSLVEFYKASCGTFPSSSPHKRSFVARTL